MAVTAAATASFWPWDRVHGQSLCFSFHCYVALRTFITKNHKCLCTCVMVKGYSDFSVCVRDQRTFSEPDGKSFRLCRLPVCDNSALSLQWGHSHRGRPNGWARLCFQYKLFTDTEMCISCHFLVSLIRSTILIFFQPLF